jgi:TRAP-type C4-dicarboxylate transport system permease small subunit
VSSPPAVAEPSFPRIRRLDELWHRAECWLCGAMFLAMALLVGAAVIRDVFGTRREWIDLVVLFGLVYLGVRTRRLEQGAKRSSRGRSLAVAALLTAAIASAVYLYVEAFPAGWVWAQKLALVMMLWVALLGASMATYDRSHLALELGEKLWPARWLPLVKAAAHAITSGFCLLLLLLSLSMTLDHVGWQTTVDANQWLPAWLALLIMPYTFAAMTVRILAQTYTVATGQAAPAEEQLPT